jgi:hypothetical protein
MQLDDIKVYNVENAPKNERLDFIGTPTLPIGVPGTVKILLFPVCFEQIHLVPSILFSTSILHDGNTDFVPPEHSLKDESIFFERIILSSKNIDNSFEMHIYVFYAMEVKLSRVVGTHFVSWKHLIYDMFFMSPENSYLVERGTIILVHDRNISFKNKSL